LFRSGWLDAASSGLLPVAKLLLFLPAQQPPTRLRAAPFPPPKTLDFDFEKCCGVSLSPLNVYACLVCGKYFQVTV
jgi:hypothetical protein